MKQIFVCCYFFCVLSSCNARNESNNKPPITDSNKELITSSNSLAKKLKNIKHYTNEPLYYLFINHEQCFFQLLINDVPVFRYFKDGQIMSPIVLNNYINHSGKQTITYRLYPQTKTTYGEGLKELTEYTKVKIELYERNNADTLHSFDNQKLLLTHHSATKADGKTFIADGKDYYEYTFSFDAKVPYDLEGWENSKDLSKMDQKELLRKTVLAYQYYRKLIEETKIDEIAKLSFKSDISQVVSEYLDEELVKKTVSDANFMFTEPTFKLEPLANYRMQLYGNHKIVCLEMFTNNLKLKNNWAIWGKYTTEEGEKRLRFERLYLHIPKGKDTFEIL